MKTKQDGVAIVEFALILPVLLVLTLITTELGRAIYQYNVITKSVRDAVRYLSVQIPNNKISEAKNLIVYGNTAGTGTPLVRGLSTTNVSTPTWQTVAGSTPVINTVTVKVTGYQFNSLFTSAFGVNFGSFIYNDISATMRSPV